MSKKLSKLAIPAALVAAAGWLLLGANPGDGSATTSASSTPLGTATETTVSTSLLDAGLATSGTDGTTHIDPAAVAALLEQTPTEADAPAVDYDREAQFGQRWADVDRNGCDTRNDVLRRDLTAPTFKPGTRDCKVIGGTLHDPYTGAEIPFQPGQVIQIDHLWPLALAYERGAMNWTPEQRVAFANDPANLQAVDGPTNSSKSDASPAEWLPPNPAYRCEYVARFVFVAADYGLAITADDRSAITAVLDRCQP